MSLMQPNGLPGSEGSIMPTTGKGTLNTIKNSVIAALGAITLSQSTPSQAAPLIPLEGPDALVSLPLTGVAGAVTTVDSDTVATFEIPAGVPGNYRTHSLPFTPRLDGDLIVPVGTIGNAKFFIKVTVVDAAHPAGQVFLYPLTPTSGVNFSNPTNPNERATNITPDGYKWYTNSADLGTLYTGHVEGPYYLDIPGGSEAKTVTIATRAILTCNDNGDAGGNNVFYNGGFTVSGVAPNTSSPDLQVGPDGKYLPNGDYSDVNQNGNTGEDVNDTDGDGNTAEAVLVPAGIYSGLEMTEIPTNFADIAGGTTISEVTGSPTLRKLTVTPGKFPGTTFDIEQSTDFSSWSTLGTYAQSPTTPTEIEVSTSGAAKKFYRKVEATIPTVK